MNKVAFLLVILFPWLSFAEDELKLKLKSNEIESKELDLNEKLKQQDSHRTVKNYPGGSMIKVEKVDPNNSIKSDSSYFSNKHTEFTDKNDISVYKKDPASKQDKGIGLSVSVPLTEQ